MKRGFDWIHDQDEFEAQRNFNRMQDLKRQVEALKEEATPVDPAHYTAENGRQLWHVMPDMGTKEEFLGYCKFNVIKYVNRYNKKNGIEDLRKAIKYAERMIEFLETGK